MASPKAEHAKLLLTLDLLQRDGRLVLPAGSVEDGAFGLRKRRFPPIDDLLTALDHIASRNITA